MMKVSLVCFTRMGFETMKKIAGTGSAGGNEEKCCLLYTSDAADDA